MCTSSWRKNKVDFLPQSANGDTDQYRLYLQKRKPTRETAEAARLEFGLGKSSLAGVLKRDPVTGILKPVIPEKDTQSQLEVFARKKIPKSGEPKQVKKVGSTGKGAKIGKAGRVKPRKA